MFETDQMLYLATVLRFASNLSIRAFVHLSMTLKSLFAYPTRLQMFCGAKLWTSLWNKLVLNLSRLFTVQLSKFCLLLEASRCRCSSQRQLIYYITVELVCQQLFILFFQAVWLVRSAVLGDSLFILSQAISFVNNFFILFSKVCFPYVVSRNGLSYYHHCFLLSTIFFMFFTRNT